MIERSTSSFNTVNVFSEVNINIVADLYGVGVEGISMDNIVNVYSGITTQRDTSTICGGSLDNDGSADSNSINISGTIESDGDISIVGAKADNTEGNIVSFSEKIVSAGTVTIAGSNTSNSAVSNKVTIYETAEIPDTCVLYGGLDKSTNENSLEISFNKRLKVGTIINLLKFYAVKVPNSYPHLSG
ncbi:MAG: hypothetical protein LBD17_02575 [Endomicrobium sp.]|nr:hypothetical protein [Endomicrobium sp.]